jgi:hypothetical protein
MGPCFQLPWPSPDEKGRGDRLPDAFSGSPSPSFWERGRGGEGLPLDRCTALKPSTRTVSQPFPLCTALAGFIENR